MACRLGDLRGAAISRSDCGSSRAAFGFCYTHQLSKVFWYADSCPLLTRGPRSRVIAVIAGAFSCDLILPLLGTFIMVFIASFACFFAAVSSYSRCVLLYSRWGQ